MVLVQTHTVKNKRDGVNLQTPGTRSQTFQVSLLETLNLNIDKCVGFFFKPNLLSGLKEVQYNYWENRTETRTTSVEDR